MATTEIKEELVTYLPLLTERQQGLLLDMVKNLLQIDKKEKRITIRRYNEEINVSVQQIKEGKIATHGSVLKHSEKWFKRK